MRSTHYGLKALSQLAVCALIAVGFGIQTGAQEAKKVDPTGTWTWTVQGRGGGPERTSTLKLKAEGEKVTGKLITPGRRGGDPREVDIEQGKITGDEISFVVTREFGGNTFSQKYVGKISGDTIKGKIEFQRGGETQTREWEAKRKSEEKKPGA